MKEIYLDNAATTKLDESILKGIKKSLKNEYANPSSIYNSGQIIKNKIENARKIILNEMGTKKGKIIFTSSATESNNLAIKGIFWSNFPKKDHIITTKIEHDSITKSCEWLEKNKAKITYLDVDKYGFINLAQLKKSINKKTALVSIIHANNEIGTIQNLKEIGKICKEKGALFHTDACQSFTKVPINVEEMNIDLMTLSAHKVHGPKGVGALYIRENVQITPLLHGGGQEFGIRSSTQNTQGILGFAQATQSKREIKKIRLLQEYFISELKKIPNIKINGPEGKDRLPNNINISFNNIEAEAIGAMLNTKKISVSMRSACSSNTLKTSPILRAIGKTHLEANSSIRISLSKYTTKREIDKALKEIKKTVNLLRKISPFN